jgi:hypothetical protein
VVENDDAVLKLRVRRRSRQAKGHIQKRRRRHGVPREFYLRQLRYFKLAGRFCPCVDVLQEGHRRAAYRFRGRQNNGVKVVLYHIWSLLYFLLLFQISVLKLLLALTGYSLQHLFSFNIHAAYLLASSYGLKEIL